MHDIEFVQVSPSRRIALSSRVYCDTFLNFTPYQEFYFGTAIKSGLFFPQILQFIFVMICVCRNFPTFGEVFLCNLYWCIFGTFAWYLLKLHKFLPGVCTISCFFGEIIFKFKLHYIAIILVSLLVAEDYLIIFYCLASGFIAGLVRFLLVSLLSTVRYNDDVAIYASRFKS